MTNRRGIETGDLDACDTLVGERGWWVSAATAEDALAEVLRESEELGWIAQRDYHTHERDAEGMRPVTIEIGRAP